MARALTATAVLALAVACGRFDARSGDSSDASAEAGTPVIGDAAPPRCAVVGPRSPRASRIILNDDDPEGPGWADTDNILGRDPLSAAAYIIENYPTTDFLVGDDFGFDLPAGAKIVGVEIDVTRSAACDQCIADYRIQIVRPDGTMSGTHRVGIGLWESAETVARYGDAKDVWNEALSGADASNPRFGVAFSARLAVGYDTTLFVNHMELSLHYCE